MRTFYYITVYQYSGVLLMKKAVAPLLILLAAIVALSPTGDAAVNKQLFHYLEENSSRYEAFQDVYPGIPFDSVAALVNANVDFPPYTGIVTVDDPDSISVLVNQKFSLPSGYVPPDLVAISSGHLMRREAAEHFEMMRDEMLRLGYRVHVVVTYRSYQTQTATYNNAVARFGRVNADVSFARPGHSEHHTGLAIDVLHRGHDGGLMMNMGFENSKQFEWLVDNAHEYGFILRYPNGYRQFSGFIFEPWHWRYVGVPVATAMREEGIALYEEFYGRYLVEGVLDNVNAYLLEQQAIAAAEAAAAAAANAAAAEEAARLAKEAAEAARIAAAAAEAGKVEAARIAAAAAAAAEATAAAVAEAAKITAADEAGSRHFLEVIFIIAIVAAVVVMYTVRKMS
jgi:D-alanyl-D-alanine carboxypeptidase